MPQSVDFRKSISIPKKLNPIKRMHWTHIFRGRDPFVDECLISIVENWQGPMGHDEKAAQILSAACLYANCFLLIPATYRG